MGFKNKRILITAGPTWVPIDGVRVISNTATGETGILLAKKLAALGAQVTLLLGPVGSCCINKKIRLIRFKFFDELKNTLTREVRTKKYGVVVHSAAVADYRVQNTFRKKISSKLKKFTLRLVSTKKLIDCIKKIDKGICLVAFKFEPQAGKEELLSEARSLLKRTDSDLVVANTVHGKKYCAYIVDEKFNTTVALDSKYKFVKSLISKVKNFI